VQRLRVDGGDIVEVRDHDSARTTNTADAATAADGTVWVHADGATFRLRPLTRREAMEVRLAEREREAGASDPDLRAPMPGAVVAIHAADGDEVAAGDRVVTIEAMKMEYPLIAGHGGVVRLRTAVGEQVSRDQVLATVTAHPAETTGRDASADEQGANGASVTPTETAVG